MLDSQQLHMTLVLNKNSATLDLRKQRRGLGNSAIRRISSTRARAEPSCDPVLRQLAGLGNLNERLTEETVRMGRHSLAKCEKTRIFLRSLPRSANRVQVRRSNLHTLTSHPTGVLEGWGIDLGEGVVRQSQKLKKRRPSSLLIHVFFFFYR